MDPPNRILEQSASSHRPCRATREMSEKGAAWTDWIPTSFCPSRLSSLSRSAILRGVPHVRTIESLAGQHRCSTAF